MRCPVWILPLLLVVGACGDPSADHGARAEGSLLACEPLEATEVPTTIGNVLGIGQAADGVFYLVDQQQGEPRLFVSGGGELQRVRIAGAGSTPSSLVLSVSERQPPFRLKLEGAGTPALRMGLWTNPDPTRRDFDVGVEGETLGVRERGAVAGLALRNLEGDVHTEYLAKLQDGQRLVVVRPEDDWQYLDFRLFLGTPERMEERTVLNVTRGRDGGTTTIWFTLDGLDAVAYFPTAFRPDETATLTAGSLVLPMTVETGQAPEGLQFFCRQAEFLSASVQS